MDKVYITEKHSQVEILRKTENFLGPQWELNLWPSKYKLDGLTTELWETRGEQGHILGSCMQDTCPATLQGATCRNDKCE